MRTLESDLATQPQHYIAYAPHGLGLECALCYFVEGAHVYGWWTGFKDYQYPSAFFMIEHYFSDRNTILYATEGADIYGGWRYDYSRRAPKLDSAIAVDDAICHKLERLQDAFANEWLWYRGDPGSDEEARAYERAELAVQDVNLKHRQLGKLRKDAPVWIERSRGLDLGIVDYLAARWPLDYERP
jgi:hypothetical protein